VEISKGDNPVTHTAEVLTNKASINEICCVLAPGNAKMKTAPKKIINKNDKIKRYSILLKKLYIFCTIGVHNLKKIIPIISVKVIRLNSSEKKLSKIPTVNKNTPSNNRDFMNNLKKFV
jgi:hypothetical protein